MTDSAPTTTPATAPPSPEKNSVSSAEDTESENLSGGQSMKLCAPGSSRVEVSSTSFTLQIDNLPAGLRIRDLWAFFAAKGNVTWIGIHPNQDHKTPPRGKIVFNPPPDENFWKDGYVAVPIPTPSNPGNHARISITPWKFAPIERYKQGGNGNKYSLVTNVELSAIDFGSFMNANMIAVAKSLVSSDPGNQRFECNFASQTMIFYFSFPFKHGKLTEKLHYKLVASLSAVQRVWASDAHQLALSFSSPIHYFWRLNDVYNTIQDEAMEWSINETWHRATGVCDSLAAPLSQPVSTYSNIPDCDSIDISRLNAFQLTLKGGKDVKNETSFENIIKGLEDMNIEVVRQPDVEIRRNQPNMWQMLDHPPTAHITKAVDLLFLSTTPSVSLEFSVRYRLEVCVTRGLLNEYAVDAEFLQRLSSLDASSANRRLDLLIDDEKLLENPIQLFEDPSYSYFTPKQRVPHHCAMVYKAHLTPTALKLNPPSVESSNRVMRQYSHLQDRFLRVQFLEETESSRIAKDRNNNEGVWIRLLRALHRGIRIGDRTFEFLAFGNSQLREGSVTFFAPTSHVSCDDIRQWLGDFSHIRSVAKFGARIGQCFSTSREIRGIRMPDIKYIDDIERDGHCFTDGVGIISNLLAQLVVDEMALDVFEEASAFQFRMGGCKGVLAVWPSAYARRTEVHIRKSQEKFTSSTNSLEILRCARASTATLNRQTIVILEHLKVPVSAFKKLLDKQVEAYQKAMTDTDAAIEILTKYVDENQTTLIVAELLKFGFKDQFVTNMLTLWKTWSLKLVKEKARIHVENSAFVIGVVDETGTLRGHCANTEGSQEKNIAKLPQIFLQLSKSKHHRGQIVRGLCMVGRNPSLHPGDIRVVQAVDNPKLRHLKDVVVFPSQGDKPVPSMLSGGDLDGDEYFVIWDPTLLPNRWNIAPMVMKAVSPVTLDRDVTANDLRDFVVEYMKNDWLPLIATAHLAFSDQIGVNSHVCLQLAEMHSQAVDYPKTGVPVEWNQQRLNPKRWPHFMEKRNSYHSRKALGQLYDRVARADTTYNPQCEDIFDRRVIEKYQTDDSTLAKAKEIKAQYDFAVRRILKQHRIATEFELYSGWAMSRPAVGSDYKRQEDLGREFDALKERFRDICYEAAGGLTPELLDPFVAAMYRVTEDEVQAAIKGEAGEELYEEMDSTGYVREPLISFPWIFHWILIRIAVGDDYKPSQSALAAARRSVPMTAKMDVLNHRNEVIKNETEINAHADEELKAEDMNGQGDGVAEVAGAETTAQATARKENKVEKGSGKSDAEMETVTAADKREINVKESAVERLMRMLGTDSDENEDDDDDDNDNDKDE